MSKIIKTTFTVTVLHESFDSFTPENLVEMMSLEGIGGFIDNGDGIGATSNWTTDEVPPEKVRDELLALGNDGEFFLSDDDDEEEQA